LYFYGRLLMLYVQFKGKQEDKKKAHHFPFLQGPNLMSWSHYKFLQLPKPQYLIQTCRRAPPSVYIVFVSCALCQWNNSVTSSYTSLRWVLQPQADDQRLEDPEEPCGTSATTVVGDAGARWWNMLYAVSGLHHAPRSAKVCDMRCPADWVLDTSQNFIDRHACCISPRLHGVCEYRGK
jgi:hypothetical protein